MSDQLKAKPTDSKEVKAIKNFLTAKSKMAKSQVDKIPESETDRIKVTKAVLKEHGVSEKLMGEIGL